jgi:hypothetical protein
VIRARESRRAVQARLNNLRVLLVLRFDGYAVTLLVVGDRCLDRVFREDRAVNLDRRQRQFFSDLR